MNVLDIYKHTLSEMLEPGKREISPVNICNGSAFETGTKVRPLK